MVNNLPQQVVLRDQSENKFAWQNCVTKETTLILIISGKFICDCHLFPVVKQPWWAQTFPLRRPNS